MTTPMQYELARPDDPDVDDFACGEPEVDGFFQKRAWVKGDKVSPTTYKFFAPTVGVPAVAYASAAFGNYLHPDNASTAKARYLVIYAVGVSVQLHGMREPGSGQTYAMRVFLELEVLARQKDGCVGLALRVRSDNGRAIGFYEKVGFVADPGGPVPAQDGAPYLTMRRLF